MKIYHETQKEEIAEKSKIYRENNLEAVLEKKKVYYCNHELEEEDNKRSKKIQRIHFL